ncbi:MAG: phage tail protein [Scytonematopsis contorta HA4267-MV1]|jgi:phage tail-like protein|nr:phage tail protein [Scytonematopsis contorta HA4267-MV1]
MRKTSQKTYLIKSNYRLGYDALRDIIDPLAAYNFFVEIDGLLTGGFTEVTGLGSQISLEEYKEGGVNGYVHKFPTQTSYEPLVLSKGLTILDTLSVWYQNASAGNIERKNGSIILFDRMMEPVKVWDFHNAYPVKWTGPKLNASSDEIAVESIELVHQGIFNRSITHLISEAMF